MEGLDVVTLDAESGLIERVDGFFGHPTPIKAEAAVCLARCIAERQRATTSNNERHSAT